MKKLLYILIAIVLVSFKTQASNTTYNINNYNYNGNSFTFIERGISFSVFQNGEFDFFINQQNNLNVNYQTRNVNISFNAGYNYDAYVQYDNYGAVIQIQSTPIYYDYYGRVNQIGTIYINYNNGRVTQLGSMNVYYNRYGTYSHYRGYINKYNRHYVYNPCFDYLIRPHYNYRVVSYKPYRHHYSPYRYTYHKNHSKNKYYNRNSKHYKSNNGHGKYEKRNSTSTRQRLATSSIPKRSKEYYASNSRSNSRAQDLFKNDKNNYNKVGNSSNRRSANNISRPSESRNSHSSSNDTSNRSSSNKEVTQKRSTTSTRTNDSKKESNYAGNLFENKKGNYNRTTNNSAHRSANNVKRTTSATRSSNAPTKKVYSRSLSKSNVQDKRMVSKGSKTELRKTDYSKKRTTASTRSNHSKKDNNSTRSRRSVD